jgi:hypothetical protein
VTYVCAGNGGYHEGLNLKWLPQPTLSAVRSSDFNGFGIITLGSANYNWTMYDNRGAVRDTLLKPLARAPRENYFDSFMREKYGPIMATLVGVLVLGLWLLCARKPSSRDLGSSMGTGDGGVEFTSQKTTLASYLTAADIYDVSTETSTIELPDTYFTASDVRIATFVRGPEMSHVEPPRSPAPPSPQLSEGPVQGSVPLLAA